MSFIQFHCDELVVSLELDCRLELEEGRSMLEADDPLSAPL